MNKDDYQERLFKIQRIELNSINGENLEERYNVMYWRWKYLASNKVTIQGKLVEPYQRFWYLFPKEDGSSNLVDVEVEEFDHRGTPLTELLFIEEKKREYNSYLEEFAGIRKYSDIIYKIRLVLGYMEQRERELSKPSQSTKFKGFDSKLNTEQIRILVPLLNDAELFKNPIDETILMNLFNGSLEKPLKLNNNRLLAYFFNELKEKRMITRNWQAAAEKTKSFISSDDKEIISNDLSKALSELKENGNPKNSTHIDKAIKQL